MSLGNTSIHQKGEIPEITKLPNDRIRVVRRFQKFTREDVDNANLGSLMGNFGDLDTTGEQITNQGYTDCRLISVEVDTRFNSQANADNAVLVKTYETLTSSFVQIVDDTVAYTESGLKQVTRVYRAVSGTTSSNVVGTTAISGSEPTIILASSEIEDNDAFAQLTEVYLETGILSVDKTSMSDGVYRVSTQFAHTEGSVVGPIISRKTENFSGYKTITVDSMQDASGNSIVDGGTNLVHQYKTFEPFQYPGVVEINTSVGSTTGGNEFVSVNEKIIRPPAQARVLATTYVFFQTASDITQADYTYDLSDGLWSPNNWASASVDFSATGFSGINISKGFRGYRTDSNSASDTLSQVLLAFPFATYDNKTIIDSATSISYDIDIEKGPPDPIGNKYTLNASITPAFDDVDGTTYYKKTIVVTDSIPSQVATATLPYD